MLGGFTDYLPVFRDNAVLHGVVALCLSGAQRGASRRGALLFRRCHDRIHEKLTEFKSS